MTSTPGNHEPPKTSTDKVWYNLRMVWFLNRYCLFWPSANWSRSHDSFAILGTLFCTLQPYKANSRIAIKQDTCKQNRVASCKLRKTDGNKIFLAYFSCRLFTLVCFRAIRCGNETPMILRYILSLQDHQRDGEVNRQVVMWNTLKCGQTLPLLRILMLL